MIELEKEWELLLHLPGIQCMVDGMQAVRQW